MSKSLCCIGDTLTPKMRRALKLIVENNKVDGIKQYCRDKGMAFDIIPINKDNTNRIAVLLNQVKSIKS